MRSIFFTVVLVVFAFPSFAANGYQATAAWWTQAHQNVSQHSLLLQNIYADVEAQVGPDKNRLTQAFAKRLAQQYPGSNYFGNIGTLAINGYTHLTYDNSWQIVAARQTIGSLQKTLDFRNLTATYVNGPNRVVFKLDPRNIERSQFTSVEIPAITVTARNIWVKKADGRGQPLKDILNDVYAYRIAASEGMNMDQLAEGMVSDDTVRQRVLSVADALYSQGLPRQMAAAGEGQPANQSAQSGRSSSAPGLFSKMPWYFWPAIVLVGAASALTGNRRRRGKKRSSSWPPPPRRKYDDFTLGRHQPAEDGIGSQKSWPEPDPNSIGAREEKPTEWSIEVLKSLEWKRFETVCAEYFRMTGFDAKETPLGADGGVDIWVYKPGVERPAGIVQCKAWNTYKVGVGPVRELYGVMTAENVAHGKFMTSGIFTNDALAFAEGKKLELISGERFLGVIKKLPEDKQRVLFHIATEGDYRTPTCPQCGVKMTLREGRGEWNDFWGCPNYPRCKAKLFCKAEED